MLIAGLAGALIALAGQQWGTQKANKARAGELLLEQCAQIVALSEDFRNRAWEETAAMRATSQVPGPSLAGYRSYSESTSNR